MCELGSLATKGIGILFLENRKVKGFADLESGKSLYGAQLWFASFDEDQSGIHVNGSAEPKHH